MWLDQAGVNVQGKPEKVNHLFQEEIYLGWTAQSFWFSLSELEYPCDRVLLSLWCLPKSADAQLHRDERFHWIEVEEQLWHPLHHHSLMMMMKEMSPPSVGEVLRTGWLLGAADELVETE